MTDGEGTGWFAGDGIREGSAAEPADWPARAVAAGFAEDEADYYAKLHDAAVEATREAVRAAERADDQQLIHAVRAMDDIRR